MRRILLILALAAGGAHAQQPRDACADAYNAEMLRIQRDLKAQPGDSEAAKQRIARMTDSQVKAAASRRRECQAAANPAPSSKDRAADCATRAAKYSEEIEWRYGRREKTAEERAAYYEEVRKNREWRAACLREARQQ